MREVQYRVSDDEYRDLCRGTGSDSRWDTCERFDFNTGKWNDDDVAWDVMEGQIPAYRITAKEAQQMIRDEGPAQAPVSKGNAVKSHSVKSSRKLPTFVKVFIAVAAVVVVLIILAAIGGSKGAGSSDSLEASGEVVTSGVDTDQYAAVVSETENTAEQSSQDGDSTTSADSSGVTPEIKAALDSYEEIMNQYVDFMLKYQNASSADALSMLSDYTSMLGKYADAMSALSEIDEGSLGAADLAYYLDVTSRVTKRLLEVAQ